MSPSPALRTRTPIRRRTTIAAALTLSALVGLAHPNAASAAAPAAQSSPAPASPSAVVTSPVPGGRSIEYQTTYQWTDESRVMGGVPSRAITLGLDTRFLSLDVQTEVAGSVACEYGEEHFGSTTVASFSEAQWRAAEPKLISIPAVERGLYHLVCTSGEAGEKQSRLRWEMSSSRGGNVGETLTLSDDEAAMTVRTDTATYTTIDGTRQLTAGDVVRVTGAPGTWPANRRVFVALQRGSERQSDVVHVSGVRASADGSGFEFVVPTPPTPDYFLPNAGILASSEFLSPDEDAVPRYAKFVRWSQPFTYASAPAPTASVSPSPTTVPSVSPSPTTVPSVSPSPTTVPSASPSPSVSPTPAPVASSISIALASRYSVSILRMPVTATVKNADGSRPNGTVSFAANGKVLGSAAVGQDGLVTFALPKLARNTYSVTATFTPTGGAASVKSAGAWLRVLR